MTVSERVAYLKGLSEGLKLDTETNEGKLISVIIETLEDIAFELEDLNENALDIGDELDAISEDLADVEEVLFGIDGEDEDEDEDEDDVCDCCSDDCCSDDCCCDDAVVYEVTCPSCNEDIVLEEEDIKSGSIKCPKCSEKLEFVFDEEEEDK